MLSIILLSVSLSALAQAQAQAAPPQVPVTVYYESLCPDSIKFFNKQLYPVFISSVQPRINLTLVPYGRASYEEHGADHIEFKCHHGPNECYGNKVQACAIKKVPDQQKLMSLLNCLMESVLPDRNGTYPIETCAEKTGVVRDVDDIVTCANGTDGQRFLKELGIQTDRLQPKLKSVPTIVVNGSFNEANQASALTNLKGLVCSLVEGDKPTDCRNVPAGSATAVFTTSLMLLLAAFYVI